MWDNQTIGLFLLAVLVQGLFFHALGVRSWKGLGLVMLMIVISHLVIIPRRQLLQKDIFLFIIVVGTCGTLLCHVVNRFTEIPFVVLLVRALAFVMVARVYLVAPTILPQGMGQGFNSAEDIVHHDEQGKKKMPDFSYLNLPIPDR